jgi:hypothetical protein
MASGNEPSLTMKAAFLSEAFQTQMERTLAPLKQNLTERDKAYAALKAKYDQSEQNNRKLLVEGSELRAQRSRLYQWIAKLEGQIEVLRHHLTPNGSNIQPFTGEREKWNDYVELVFRQIQRHPMLFGTDRKKAFYLLGYMRGAAEGWALLITDTAQLFRSFQEVDNFQVLVAKATLAWGTMGLESRITHRLMDLKMVGVGEADMVEYNTVFISLAEKINWSEALIVQKYMRGLHPGIQDHLKGYLGGISLSDTMAHVLGMVKGIRSQV